MTKYVVGALALCALVGCGSVDEGEAQQAVEVELASEKQALVGARLNVNYATVAGLDALPGVSKALAAAIVAEREQGGVFWTRGALLQRVPGMSRSVYTGLKERVKVGGCFSGTDCGGADERCMLRDETLPWLGGVCYPQNSCANVRCAGGSCVMSTAQCSGAACAPSPVCQPEQTSGCAAVMCAEGTVCVMKQVQCVTAPCPEQPVCEAPAAACMCTREYDPVCGSDGKTYGNPCTARCAGVSFNAGECGAETCMCPQIYDPVCGADGKTYGNACMASCAKVSAVSGACN